MLSSYPYFSDMQSFSQVKSRVVVFHLEISTKKVHPRKTNITMENHHFQWENPRNKWPFSIAMLVYQRVFHIDGKVENSPFLGSGSTESRRNDWVFFQPSLSFH